MLIYVDTDVQQNFRNDPDQHRRVPIRQTGIKSDQRYIQRQHPHNRQSEGVLKIYLAISIIGSIAAERKPVRYRKNHYPDQNGHNRHIRAWQDHKLDYRSDTQRGPQQPIEYGEPIVHAALTQRPHE